MRMHHANLLIGSAAWALTMIPEADRMAGLDVSHRTFERMGIDEVRKLSNDASLRPIERASRTFVLTCGTILPEAQNALLKLFEEPNETTVFYLILSSESILIPTLRSRLNLFAREEGSSETTQVFESFRRKNPAERLAVIAEKLKSEDPLWVRDLMHGFEVYAHEARDTALMEDVLLSQAYLAAPGSSKKMLLEHLALSL